MERKRAHYTHANCKFWVFEEVELPGAFIEFFEAADLQTLAKAHAAAPDGVLDAARVYAEVELR
ncbi:MAG TPA: hypothetical protein VMH39_14885 [Gemmatimonadaceae bacterium]|nr:hypothetical protein [Gemmatimonadaceae bacterium]